MWVLLYVMSVESNGYAIAILSTVLFASHARGLREMKRVLTRILGEMLAGQYRAKRLRRGLGLAYSVESVKQNGASSESRRHCLAISRIGIRPSEAEVAIVLEALLSAINGRLSESLIIIYPDKLDKRPRNDGRFDFIYRVRW